MLYLIKRFKKVSRSSIVLLFFISCIAFHTIVSADIQNQTAEEYRALGFAEQQKGNLNEALSYYTKATSLGLENVVLLNDMGVLYEEIDLNYRAEQYYLRAIQKDRTYLPVYINLAYLYQKFGRKKEAARYFKMRYELGDPKDPWAQKAKDELLRIAPEYKAWILSLEADSLNRQLEEKNRNEFYERVKRSHEHYYKGEQLFKENQYEKAMNEYNQALRFAPKDPRIINARKKIILEKAKESVREQSEQAIKRLEEGDTVSARYEIQELLTKIPNEPILISR